MIFLFEIFHEICFIDTALSNLRYEVVLWMNKKVGCDVELGSSFFTLSVY